MRELLHCERTQKCSVKSRRCSLVTSPSKPFSVSSPFARERRRHEVRCDGQRSREDMRWYLCFAGSLARHCLLSALRVEPRLYPPHSLFARAAAVRSLSVNTPQRAAVNDSCVDATHVGHAMHSGLFSSRFWCASEREERGLCVRRPVGALTCVPVYHSPACCWSNARTTSAHEHTGAKTGWAPKWIGLAIGACG